MVHLSADPTGTRSSGRRSRVGSAHPCGHARVGDIVIDPHGCTLIATSIQGEETEVTVDIVPDRRLASLWAATVRRLSWVELCRRGGTWQCTIHGTGYRLPIARRAPVAVGLGLAIAGTPLLLCDEAT